jgi:hypothetical protein
VPLIAYFTEENRKRAIENMKIDDNAFELGYLAALEDYAHRKMYPTDNSGQKFWAKRALERIRSARTIAEDDRLQDIRVSTWLSQSPITFDES